MKVKEWFQVSVPGSQTGGKISLWQKIKNLKWMLLPRGWIYQNMATIAKLGNKQLGGFDSQNDITQPQKFGDLTRELNVIAKPYKFFAAEAIPNFAKARQTTAHNQTMVNEAQIACALERYHLAHNEYPETPDALAPQFTSEKCHRMTSSAENPSCITAARMMENFCCIPSVGTKRTTAGASRSRQRRIG